MSSLSSFGQCFGTSAPFRSSRAPLVHQRMYHELEGVTGCSVIQYRTCCFLRRSVALPKMCPFAGPTGCESNTQCTVPGEICCPVKNICEEPLSTNPLACGEFISACSECPAPIFQQGTLVAAEGVMVNVARPFPRSRFRLDRSDTDMLPR